MAKETFKAARARLLTELKARGWETKPSLKVPQARPPGFATAYPDQQFVVYFHPQAVYLDKHSLWSDIRGMTVDAFIKDVETTHAIRQKGDRREMGLNEPNAHKSARDYDSADDALAKAYEFLGAEFYTRDGDAIAAYIPIDLETGQVYDVARLFKAKGLFHWPDSGFERVSNVPAGAKPTPQPRFDAKRRREVSEAPQAERRVPSVSFDDTEIRTWFERDRAHVDLVNKRTNSTIIEWWDQDVFDAIEAGFLDAGRKPFRADSAALHRSAYEYAISIGLIRSPYRANEAGEEGKGDARAQPGYAFYAPKDGRDWRHIPNDDWEHVIVDSSEIEQLEHVGSRMIDGTKHNIFKRVFAPRSIGFYAQLAHMTREEAPKKEPLRAEENVELGIPWVKVSRDPEQYAAAMKLAAEVGAIDDPRKVYDLLHPVLSEEDQEVLIVVSLDVRQQIRGVTEVHRGGRSHVGVDTPDVLRAVLQAGGESFIMVHNHPSGKATPSKADGKLTEAVDESARQSDLTLRDHVVIGMGQYFSFAKDKLYRVKN